MGRLQPECLLLERHLWLCLESSWGRWNWLNRSLCLHRGRVVWNHWVKMLWSEDSAWFWPISNAADAQAGVPQGDSGSTEGMWSAFQYVNVPSPYILGLQGKKLPAKGSWSWDVEFLNCNFPVPSAEGCEIALEDVVGRKNMHISTSPSPYCKSEHKAAARSWQPPFSLCLLHRPLTLVPWRDQLTSCSFGEQPGLTAAIPSAMPDRVIMSFLALGGHWPQGDEEGSQEGKSSLRTG